MKLYILACAVLLVLGGCRHSRQTLYDLQKAESLFEEGKAKEKSGKIDSAIICYRTSIELLEKCDTCKLKVEIYQQLASLLWLYRYYDRSIETYRTAYALAENFSDKSYASALLRGIGGCHLLNNRVDSALYYFNAAFQYIPHIQNTEEIASIYNNLSALYTETEDYRQAILWNQKALSCNSKPDTRLRNYVQKAYLHLKTNQLDSAEHYAMYGMASEDPYIKSSCLETLYGVAVKLHSPDSLKYYAQLTNLSDSLWRENKAVEIGEAEIILKQQQLNQGMQKVTDKRRLLLWFLVVAAALYAGVRLFVRRHSKAGKTAEDSAQETNPEPEPSIPAPPAYNNELIYKKGDMLAELFRNSLTYQRLADKLEKDETISYQEQFELVEAIEKGFDSFIEELTASCKLTKEEALLCCLTLTGLSNRQCAICKNVSENAIRTQKSRVKSKMVQNNNSILFESIFRKKNG